MFLFLLPYFLKSKIFILLSVFPKEYETRALECKLEESDNRMTLPLFIMNGICFPGEELPLHVYEPRYRIMLK